MAFLNGYKHDLFVSYAHNDNEPYIEGDIGWVKHLVKALRTGIVQAVGKDTVDIWMDYKLQGNDAITPTIMDELAGSALLLFVFSESYLASGWCRSIALGSSQLGGGRACIQAPVVKKLVSTYEIGAPLLQPDFSRYV
jgi:hypothetical protein